MPTTELVPTSIIAASGWAGATVANLSTSNDVRATDGVAGEFINSEMTDSPGDFFSQNLVFLNVEARVVGTVNRLKQILVELLDGVDAVLESFTTPDLTGSDVTSGSTGFLRSDGVVQIDAYRLRCTVQEGSGMPDSATVEIDKMWVVLDYDVAGVGPPAGLRTLALTGAGV